MEIVPLHDKVVVKRSDRETLTSSGLVIPDNGSEKPNTGTVVAVGPGKMGEDGTRLPMDVKKGDTVIFGKFAGSSVWIGREEMLVLSEGDIAGILRG